MTITKLSLLTLAFGATIPVANAALVNIGSNTLAAPARLVVSTAGDVLPIGSMVRIGLFPAGAPVVTPATTFAQLNALFVPIGEDGASPADGTNGPGATNSNAAGGAGWAFTINSVDNTDARFAATTRIYLMVLDVAPAQMANAGNVLIMSDPGWTIPTTGVRTMTSAQIDSQAEVNYGLWGAAQLRMAPIAGNIPEPSTGVMALLAGLGLVARRRR